MAWCNPFKPGRPTVYKCIVHRLKRDRRTRKACTISPQTVSGPTATFPVDSVFPATGHSRIEGRYFLLTEDGDFRHVADRFSAEYAKPRTELHHNQDCN